MFSRIAWLTFRQILLAIDDASVGLLPGRLDRLIDFLSYSQSPDSCSFSPLKLNMGGKLQCHSTF